MHVKSLRQCMARLAVPIFVLKTLSWPRGVREGLQEEAAFTLTPKGQGRVISGKRRTVFLFLFLFILFLAALGLRCCARAFSSCGERGLLFVAVRGLLIAVASLVAEHRL